MNHKPFSLNPNTYTINHKPQTPNHVDGQPLITLTDEVKSCRPEVKSCRPDHSDRAGRAAGPPPKTGFQSTFPGLVRCHFLLGGVVSVEGPDEEEVEDP